MESEKENIYIQQILECHKIADQISHKITLISTPSNVKETDRRPVRSRLESELDLLLEHLQDINQSIIV